MRVAELVAVLQEMPQDAEVLGVESGVPGRRLAIRRVVPGLRGESQSPTIFAFLDLFEVSPGRARSEPSDFLSHAAVVAPAVTSFLRDKSED